MKARNWMISRISTRMKAPKPLICKNKQHTGDCEFRSLVESNQKAERTGAPGNTAHPDRPCKCSQHCC